MVEGVARAIGAELDVRLRWRGEQLDRLLDDDHAQLVDAVVRMLQSAGWDVVVEASFSIWGERGSIDVFAYHSPSGIVLVVEVKSVVPDSQATLGAFDRKARLAPKLAAERGWQCKGVARLLVIGASATSRRRIARLATTYGTALPMRGHDVRAWIRRPTGFISGLLFVSYATTSGIGRGLRGRQRVRRMVEWVSRGGGRPGEV